MKIYRLLLATIIMAPVWGIQSTDIDKSEPEKFDFVEAADQLLIEEKYEEAISLAESNYRRVLATLGPRDYEMWIVVMGTTNVVRYSQPRDSAMEKLTAMLGELESKFGANNYSLIYVLEALGSLQRGEEQVTSFDRALRIQRETYPENLLRYALLLRNMGFVLVYETKRYALGLQYLSTALPVYEEEFGLDHVYTSHILMALGTAYTGFNHSSLALQNYERAISIVDEPGSEELHANFLYEAGSRLGLDVTGEKAIEFLEQSRAEFEALDGRNSARTIGVRVALAEAFIGVGRAPAAVPELLTARELVQTADDQQDLEKDILKLLVEVYEDMGQRDEATRYCLAISQSSPGHGEHTLLPVLKKPPVYPPEGVKNGEEGYVIVEYIVDANGFVVSPRIVESTVSEVFNQPAIDASYKFRYAPAMKDGKLIDTPGVKNKFTFKFN